MKIRINGNHLRLRLNVDDWELFRQTGKVEDSIQFDPMQKLIYTLRVVRDSKEVKACYNHPFIMVLLPEEVAQHWMSSSEVGIETTMPLNKEDSLKILVEKDFKCLQTRSEDHNLFPHPETLNS